MLRGQTLPVMGVVSLWLIAFSFLLIVHGVGPDFTRDGCSIPVAHRILFPFNSSWCGASRYP